jgi:hypothetical protein
VHTLVTDQQDTTASLDKLAQRLGAANVTPQLQPAQRPGRPRGKLTAAKVCKAVGHLLPENAIIVDEAITSGLMLSAMTAGAPRHDLITLTGGAIGQGLPNAVGAAIACPDRPVLALIGDGTAMYTIQALWTMAREQLNVTSIIFNNATYSVLNVELERVGAESIGAKAKSQLDISGHNSIERHAGQDGQQRLGAEGSHVALHREHRGPALQTHQRGGDGAWRQVHLRGLLGADGLARQWRAHLPVDMDGLHRLQADVHRAVHRRAGGRQDADDGERLVGMVVGLQCAVAMAEHDALAQRIAQPARHLVTEHHGVVQPRRTAGPRASTRRWLLAVAEVLEVAGGGAQHRKAAVAVAQAQRHHPGHAAVLGQASRCVADVVGGVADAEHRVQQQLHRPVRAPTIRSVPEMACEKLARVLPQALDAQQQERSARS